MATQSISKLPILVRDAFKAAQKTGDLTFYQTQVSILQFNGLPFQVRFSPALAKKPKSNKPRDSKEVIDPFADPPEGLFIAHLPSHNLVLNKFPIIPDHFILATKVFKKQTDLLEEDDLDAAFECLRAYRENGEELFCFFNSGEHSGASQPHRHLQFLPVESMRSGIEKGQSWEVMAELLTKTPKPNLPFAYFSHTLPESPSSTLLHETYIKLHNNAYQVVHGSRPTSLTTSISYNLGLTDRVMVLCPRAADGIQIQDGNGDDIGLVALNGTVLGGTLLVKSEEEYSALCNDQSKLTDVLKAIGFPPSKVEHDGKL
ncbi:Diadenosine 5 [Hyphodiscus hymeniophilus]|uniref:Diadenosine 5 n=1 Tax=Hyphodiscus hymeniophilus TaxID=353542 RepID=A0A9P6VFE6_9HELO|nr:Diadenosine 5 [Hyphodiscus hymeniophilus]